MKDLVLPDGRGLLERSHEQKLLFVFVRHAGCTFCREALSQLALNYSRVKKAEFKTYVVHMGEPSSGEALKQDYGLSEVEFISDPKKKFYKAFDLKRGSLKQVLGPRVWARGFVDGVLKGHGVGKLQGDGFQLGGVFKVVDGEVSHLHEPCDAADIENWDSILESEGA